MDGFSKSKSLIAVLLFIALLGIVIQFTATKWGIGLSPDSATYIAGARSIVDGQGFGFPDGDGISIPITLWPPMFSFILAIPQLVNIDPVMSARWINAFFLAGTTILIGLMVYRSTNGSKISSILASLLVVFTYDVIFVHSWAWSEPAFLFFGFLGLTLLDEYLHSTHKRFLIISSICITMASITRYPGLAFLAAATVALLFIDQRDKFPSRILRTIIYSLITSIPFILWLIRNFLVGGTIASRPFGYQPIRLDEIYSAVKIMSLWVIPGRVPASIRRPLLGLFLVGVFILLVASTIQGWKEKSWRRNYSTKLPWIIFIFTTVYAILVLFAKIYLLPKFPLDDVRYFLPIYIALLYLSVTLIYRLYDYLENYCGNLSSNRIVRFLPSLLAIGLIVIGISVLVFHSVHTLRWVEWAHRKGLGYGSKSWHETALIKYINLLPEDMIIYSNGYDAINVLTERPVYPIPKGLNASPGRTEDEVQADIDAMEETMKSSESYFVFFNGITWRRLTSDEELSERISFMVEFQTDEGTIYKLMGQ